MTNATADTLLALAKVQTALTVLAALEPTAFRYPPDCPLKNHSSYDYIIVGGGTVGSILAYRLSTNRGNKVLLIEEGTYPPLESEIAGLFPVMPTMNYDYNIPTINNSYTAQNLVGGRVDMTQGKMLGGSSSIEHMIYTVGDPHDYNHWAGILCDDSWSYESVLPEFKKLEKLVDQDLLASPSAELHGTDGMIKIQRQISPETTFYFDALMELGHKTVDDITSRTSTLGATNPLFTIGDEKRQSSAYAYIAPAKNRSNLCVAFSTKATKILIKDGKAVGVQVITSSYETLHLYANKEVIVSAGTIHTPQLLMWSGIGPKEHLKSLHIPVVADLPVGQNLRDQPCAPLLIQMEVDTSPTPSSNPYQFPVPTFILSAAINSSQTYPDYQSINLIFSHNSTGLMQVCLNVFKYSSEICNIFAKANVNRKLLLVVPNLMMPKSKGNVTLASADTTLEPIVHLGTYSNKDDLELMITCLEDFAKVLDTSKFKSVNATLVDTGLCPNLTGREYWRCVAISMSATMWHYTGTCAMGSVVDSKMLVKGVKQLRVCDASVMPTPIRGKIKAAVTMVGERCASNILSSS